MTCNLSQKALLAAILCTVLKAATFQNAARGA